MKKVIIFVFLVLLFSGCATGPVQVATNEADGIRTNYEDPKTKGLFYKYQGLLKDIYSRFNSSGIGIYKEGVGFTTLRGQKGGKFSYLLVSIRPNDINFDEGSTQSNERFSYVIQLYFPKYFKYIKRNDLDKDDIDGLAFGIYWPVRDFTQCDKYGGFIEYAIVYIPKEDVWDLQDHRISMEEVMERAEIMTSLNLAPAISVRPVF